MIKILGVMTCFNRKEKTMNSIIKLRTGNPNIQFHFIVADDNSKDGTAEALNELLNVQVLKGNGSLFYSGGMRLAIDAALCQNESFDYCMLFNDDVDFYAESIEDLLRRAENRNCIWVGPTCDTEGNLSYGGVQKNSAWRPSFRIVIADNENGKQCDTFNANCVLIPWRIFEKIGNMDSAYSHSLGDFDYGFSAKRLGIDIRVSDKFVGICCDNPIAGGWRDTSLSRKQRLKLKESPKGLPQKEWFHYLKKNYSLLTAVVYCTIPYMRILLKK